MARPAAPLLYVHPSGHLNDLVVPAGALSCLNALSLPKLGRYGFEVSDDELASASILATDFHWSIGLAGVERLLVHARRVNPAIRTVVGGISAGHYGGALFALPDVDFVVRGDSEVAFRDLVTELAAGDEPPPIANVLVRHGPASGSRRMTPDEFDATDPLEAEWFPTYARLSQWDAAAFGMGRTITVARGCTRRCPICYGSYASTFGPGVLYRSPEGLAREIARAEERGLRNLRLVLGKPSAATLREWVAGLVRAGPFRFATTVGLYLCTPPSTDDLASLETAIEAPLAISFVPPVEQGPALDGDSIEQEMRAWRAVADCAARSSRTSIDVWVTGPADPQAIARDLGGTRRGRVKVSLGAGWHVTRPIDGVPPPALVELRSLSDSIWTFYAARLLSPALARLLEPFALLDEMTRSPEREPRPEGELAPYFDALAQSWREHRLPVIPSLAFSAVPLRLAHRTLRGRARGWGAGARAERLVRRMAMQRTADRARYHGDLAVVEPGAFALAAARSVRLAVRADHTGVRLEATLPAFDLADAIAIVPDRRPASPDDPCPNGWVAALARDGLVALALPPSPAGGASRLRVTLRVQEAEAALLGAGESLLCHGKADLDYVRPPAAARGRP